MGQDLRKIFKEERAIEKHTLNKGHISRFEDKLNAAMPAPKQNKWFVYKIAASVIVLLTISILVYNNQSKKATIKSTVVDIDKPSKDQEGITLGALSPDLKKIEDYYKVNINLELSQLQVSNDNKTLVDSYMERLAELHKEYQDLNTELNTIGPNDQLISALINNLQLRLQLLQKLRKKLNELKSNKNETISV
ncbi:MAG: hypothetical protein ACSHW4_12370 [Cellulophaga sp.]